MLDSSPMGLFFQGWKKTINWIDKPRTGAQKTRKRTHFRTMTTTLLRHCSRLVKGLMRHLSIQVKWAAGCA